MPELPEVEVTRRSFVHAIEGARVIGMRLGKPLRWPLGCEPDELAGRQVLAVNRRGKYLKLEFEQGGLLVHLGMSGSLRFAAALPQPGSHDHMDLQTTQGVLRLNDPRRFGAVVYVDDWHGVVATKLLGRLGMEPLDPSFDVNRFFEGLKQRNASIKQVLMAADLVVGVGNIYASEALFWAGIRPTVSAQSLSRPRAMRLHNAIVEVLSRAVARGGSTLRDFSSADGQAGHFQLEAMVYDRQGLSCMRCASPIRMIRQGQRSSFFCPSCQKR